MKALFISADDPKLGEVNSSIFRIAMPAHYLRRAGHDIDLQNVPAVYHRQYGDVDQIDLSEIPEVVLVERLINPERVERLRLAGARRIILTFDDNYVLLPPDSKTAGYWRQHLADWLAALPLVDLVIVPSTQLADDFRGRCRQIRVVPNYHDSELWQSEKPVHDHHVIGWGGSAQHVQSWTRSGLIPALKAVLARHSDWQLHLHGYTAVPELTAEGLPFQLQPWQNLGAWAQAVMGFDLGLAPLYGDYDARRSNLKVLEYGLAGVPYLASKAAPYTECRSPGGILVFQKQHWEAELERLIGDPDFRAQLAAQGKDWAAQFTMDKGVPVYEEVLWGS